MCGAALDALFLSLALSLPRTAGVVVRLLVCGAASVGLCGLVVIVGLWWLWVALICGGCGFVVAVICGV